ncbi:MAG: lysophospholipid acyltransferase family protein [Bacteroidales bacterium]|jgi:KDO2-lipid IV(A) lauroyltransferase|nr:lysophospholipid acyltransferase family protein [Bacteroidales bacterium]
MVNVAGRIKYLPFFLASLLPLNVLFLFSTLGFLIIFYVLKLRREVTLENLTKSFPEKDIHEIRRIEKAFYKHFCDLFIEAVKLLTISETSIKKRFHINNPEILNNCYDLNKSVIFYTAHIGNWEWLGSIPLHTRHHVLAFYQPQTSKYFNNLMNILRGRFGCRMVESGKGYKTMMELSDTNILTLAIMVGDQSPVPEGSKRWMTFLNQETAFVKGADRIAKKSGQTVIFPSVWKVKRGYYEVELMVLYDGSDNQSPDDIIESYAKHLELAIIGSPDQWLWSHRRWKLKKEEQHL